MGRPNVGKSSILNALLGEDRVLVHDAPGTTRDPIDTLIEVDGRRVVLIDTAGLRKRGQMREGVEHYSQIRALQAAERSDVALVVADAVEGLTESDLSAVDRSARAHCATLLVLNKWDLAQPDLEHIRGRLRSKSRQRPPIEVCSAATGEGLHRLLPAALRLEARFRARISTRELNEALRELAEERPGPAPRPAPPVAALPGPDLRGAAHLPAGGQRPLPDDARLRLLAREPAAPAVRSRRRAAGHRGARPHLMRRALMPGPEGAEGMCERGRPAI